MRGETWYAVGEYDERSEGSGRVGKIPKCVRQSGADVRAIETKMSLYISRSFSSPQPRDQKAGTYWLETGITW